MTNLDEDNAMHFNITLTQDVHLKTLQEKIHGGDIAFRYFHFLFYFSSNRHLTRGDLRLQAAA